MVSRSEKRQQKAQEAAEAAKIKTARQYAERVFMPASVSVWVFHRLEI